MSKQIRMKIIPGMGTGGKDPDEITQAVLTCSGDINDPDFPDKCQQIFNKLQQVLENDHLAVTKCEPWNSVKVTFDIPKEAAEKLAQLAEQGDHALRELGILSIQVEGGKVISMTMVQDESDNEEVETITTSSSATASTERLQNASVTKVKPPDTAPTSQPENHGIKKEIVSEAASGSVPLGKESSGFTKGSGRSVPASPSPSGLLPFPSLLHAAQQQSLSPAVPNKSSGLSSSVAAAMFMKNLPPSAVSLLTAQEQSVLSNYAGANMLGGCGKTENLLASLISSRKAGDPPGISPLLVNLLQKDNDESPSKKLKKQGKEVSLSGATSGSLYSFNKNSSTLTGPSSTSSLSRGPGSHSWSSSLDAGSGSIRGLQGSGSALRLASLPGVSLTAISARNTQSPPVSHSQSRPKTVQSSVSLSAAGRSGLMPPPAMVTLSPVPRTSNAGSHPPQPSLGAAELRCIDSGDKKVNPVRSLGDISPSKQTVVSPARGKQRPLLINPVTGQFEPGQSGESSSEGEPDHEHAQKMQFDDDEKEESDYFNNEAENSFLKRMKHKSGSGSPKSSTSYGASEGLKLKLKVPLDTKHSSTPNNTTKKIKDSVILPHKNKIINKMPDTGGTEPKVPKLKIFIGKDKTSVKVAENNVDSYADSESSNSTNSHDQFNSEKVNSGQPELITKVKIKNVGKSSPLNTLHNSGNDDSKDHLLNSVSPFPTTVNSVNLESSASLQSSLSKRQLKKTIKKGKVDRLAVWTESLAKHGDRKDDTNTNNREAKTWPEVLESRLYPNASLSRPPSHATNSSFSKSEQVLENQTEKGGDHESSSCGSGSSEPKEPHLNWAGPGRGAEPGPGHVHTPSQRRETPASELPHRESPASELPRRDVMASELPRRDAIVSELPRRDAMASELPRRDATASELPRRDSLASESPRKDSPASELPRREELRRRDSPASDSSRRASPVSDSSRRASPASEPRCGETMASELPCTERLASELPRREATGIEPPHSEALSNELLQKEIPSKHKETTSIDIKYKETPSCELPERDVPSSDLPLREVASSELSLKETPPSDLTPREIQNSASSPQDTSELPRQDTRTNESVRRESQNSKSPSNDFSHRESATSDLPPCEPPTSKSLRCESPGGGPLPSVEPSGVSTPTTTGPLEPRGITNNVTGQLSTQDHDGKLSPQPGNDFQSRVNSIGDSGFETGVSASNDFESRSASQSSDRLSPRTVPANESPPGPDVSAQPPQDHSGHQGEDSGIESMDALSEKSPNQGESPFDGTVEPGVELNCPIPTYSSSMGPSTGKLSPPVTHPDAIKPQTVQQLEPDVSPPPPPDAERNGSNQSSIVFDIPATLSDSNIGVGKSTTLVSSCDGAHDRTDLEDSVMNEQVAENCEKHEIIPPLNCLSQHDYIANSQVISNNSNSTDSDSKTSVKDDLRDLIPVKTTLLTRRVESSFSLSSADSNTSMKSSENAVSNVTLSPSSLQSLPPGTKMVPVKLVTVSGAGNVRMVRVSPVNTAATSLPPRTVVLKVSRQNNIVGTTQSFVRYPLPASICDTTSILPSSRADASQDPDRISRASISSSDSSFSAFSSSDVSLATGISLLKKSHPAVASQTLIGCVESAGSSVLASTPTLLAASTVPALLSVTTQLSGINTISKSIQLPTQPLPQSAIDTTTCQIKAASVTFEKRSSVELPCVKEEVSLKAPLINNSLSPLSVDVASKMKDSESSQSPIIRTTLNSSPERRDSMCGRPEKTSQASIPSQPSPKSNNVSLHSPTANNTSLYSTKASNKLIPSPSINNTQVPSPILISHPSSIARISSLPSPSGSQSILKTEGGDVKRIGSRRISKNGDCDGGSLLRPLLGKVDEPPSMEDGGSSSSHENVISNSSSPVTVVISSIAGNDTSSLVSPPANLGKDGSSLGNEVFSLGSPISSSINPQYGQSWITNSDISVANQGKRKRQDTGSSVQSDKSDRSDASSEPLQKKLKEEPKGGRKPSGNQGPKETAGTEPSPVDTKLITKVKPKSIGEKIKSKDVNCDKKKTLENSKLGPSTLKAKKKPGKIMTLAKATGSANSIIKDSLNSKVNTSGIKVGKKKVSAIVQKLATKKKLGELSTKKLGRPPSLATVTTKEGGTLKPTANNPVKSVNSMDPGRRVSTRSKKPEEGGEIPVAVTPQPTPTTSDQSKRRRNATKGSEGT